MPAFYDVLTPEQTWDIAHFVTSIRDRRETVLPLRPTVVAARSLNPLPSDPWDPAWDAIGKASVPIQPLFTLGRSAWTPTVDVRALHDGREIAFLLEWSDPTAELRSLKPQEFRDAAALQFPLGKTPPFYAMGMPLGPVNLWHWKGDWQRDLDRREDVETAYPGMSVQVYMASKAPAGEIGDTGLHDPVFRSGRAAGNPLSQELRKSPMEDLNAVGIGTLTSQPQEAQNVRGQGAWKAGTWRVLFLRTLASPDGGDVRFVAGETTAVAFAVWDGSARDRNGQKSVSSWIPLEIGK